MLLKERHEPAELVLLRYLNTRIQLTIKEKYYLSNLEKGFEGEVKFDLMAERIDEERYIINDLLLEINNSFFQIDTLIISQGMIHLLDIKNYEGNCYLADDKLYNVTTGREYKNPLNQLERSEGLFRLLLQNLKFNFLVESSLIYINPEFTLYQAPMDKPYILPTQVPGFLRGLNQNPSKLGDSHKKLAEKLISLHITKNPHTSLPTYTYDQLEKGLYCKDCKSFATSAINYDIVCSRCGSHEKIEHAIKRNVEEFKQLFPDRMVTTQNIYEWCKVNLSKRTISRVLKKNYTSVGHTRDTHYK
ncbi:nuclease-related domain-containing protein [Heyndrickxia sp. MSNUG]|uniref:nuclease-related domain-containing protein n=1 Tax=Heyndrickxia sp. MSNUG TaxID=3136677 RepID=UPI003C2F3332